METSPQLSNLISEFQSATDRVAKMQRAYSDVQWQRKPSAESWSAIECIWHLNWTSEKMIEHVGVAMKGIASKPKHDGKYRLDLFGWFLVKSLSSKGRFSKFKTTAPSSSQSTLSVSDVLNRFWELQAGMVHIIEESDGRPLNAGRVISPFHAKVCYNIYSAFRITAVHEHRHVDQAERAATFTGNL
ncbi:MAG TPA: DinB family protein [Candidatus Kapabacteria bacterium]|jgi:hypothetical protein